MKKILAALLIGVFTLSSIGCSSDKTKTEKTPEPKTKTADEKTKT